MNNFTSFELMFKRLNIRKKFFSKKRKKQLLKKILNKHKNYLLRLLRRHKMPISVFNKLLFSRKPNNYYGYAWDCLIKLKSYSYREEKEIIEELVYNLKNRHIWIKKHYDNTVLYNLDCSIILFLKDKINNIDDENVKQILKKIKRRHPDECFDLLNVEEKKILADYIANIIHTHKIKGLKKILTDLIIEFKKKTISHPNDMTFDEWIQTIDEMLKYLKNKDYYKGKYLFRKYFNDLWI